jgi:hypothetical protein
LSGERHIIAARASLTNHLILRRARSARLDSGEVTFALLWDTSPLVPILRDARLRRAPQDEDFFELGGYEF